MGEQPLGEHVRPVGRVHLAVDRERQLAGHLLDGDRGAFALVEEAQPSLAQEVPVAGRLHLRRNPVEPAGKRLPVPGSGGREPEGAEAARERQRQDPGLARKAARSWARTAATRAASIPNHGISQNPAASAPRTLPPAFVA